MSPEGGTSSEAGRRVPGAARVRLLLLGPPELRIGDRLVTLPARKDMALLAMLARAPGRILSRERLAGTLWDKRAQAQARDSLRHALSRLRGALGSQEARLLVVERRTVALDPEVEADTDLLLGAASRAAVEQAILSRRGPLLEGLDLDEPGFADWPTAERAMTGTAVQELALALMRRAEAAGHAESAAQAARWPLGSDPFHEEAVRLPVRRQAEGAGSAVAVLVMPFANLGDDLHQDHFAAGLAEDIATDLARLPGLVVIPFQPGAGLVLSGSVRREQGRFRITARLLAAPTGRRSGRAAMIARRPRPCPFKQTCSRR